MKENKKLTPKQIQEIQKRFVNYGDDIIGYFTDDEKKPELEIRVVERSAIPAAYYWRDSVQEAIQAEVLRDIKAGQPVPPGFELINQEEESTNGETKEISSPEDDSTSGGDGSEPPENSENDGDQNGRGGSSDPGEPAKESHKTGPSQKTPGE